MSDVLESTWQLARCDRVAAYRAGSRLGIVAGGLAPTPCHTGRIRELDDDSMPPRYAAEWRASDGVCASQETPLIMAGAFLSPLSIDAVVVATASGERIVRVVTTDDQTFDWRVAGS